MKDSLKMDNLDNLRSMEHPFLMFLAPRASNLLQMQTAAQILQTAAESHDTLQSLANTEGSLL